MDKEFRQILTTLIETPSYTGEEAAVVKAIAENMEKLGFDEVFTDAPGNILGGIHGELPGPVILFDGHIDTVRADNRKEWAGEDPFRCYEEEGKVYGRGTSDMKGAFAAMLYALGTLDRSRLKGKVYLSGTVNEEVAEGFTIREVTRRLQPDLVVIGEATQLKVNIGQRGRGEIRLSVLGKSAHSSNPDVGINAVLKMSKALQALEEGYAVKEDVLGKGILVLTDIISEPYPGESVIPRRCTATFDRRLLLEETRESVLGGIRTILEKLAAGDPEFAYELEFARHSITTYTGYTIDGDKFYPPWRIDPEDPFLKDVLNALKEQGIESTLGSYSFCTNGSSTCGQDGIKTIGFGPGREQEAHITNEFIEASQLEDAIRGYRALAYIYS